MIRYLIIAVVVILIVIAMRLPARPIVEQLPSGAMALLQPAGTLWRGSGRLAVEGRPLGVLSWQIDPLALLRLDLHADFAVEGADLALTGAGNIGVDREFDLQLNGEIGNPLLNAMLTPYAIRIEGDLSVASVDLSGAVLSADPNASALEDVIAFSSLSGQLNWEGGLASYTLQNGTSTTPFPELRGDLALNGEQLPELAVYRPGGGYALLRTSLLSGGFVKVAVSRGLTALARMPWPSQGPDDEIVLEVEQQVF